MSKRITIQVPTKKGTFIDLEGRVVIAALGGNPIRLLLDDADNVTDMESGFHLGEVTWYRGPDPNSHKHLTDKEVVQSFMDDVVEKNGLPKVMEKLEWARKETKRLMGKQNG